MALIVRLTDVITRIASECKALRTLVNGNAADLSALATADKTNLVAAVNELKAALDAGPPIDDTKTTNSNLWSAAHTDSRISTEISAALNGILDGAPAALDTLQEIAAALNDDNNFAATTTAALGKRVRVDADQAFTEAQQTKARVNIGAQAASEIGNTDTDFVATFNAGLL